MEKVDIGRVFSGAFSVLARHWPLLLGASAVLWGGLGLLSWAVAALAPARPTSAGIAAMLAASLPVVAAAVVATGMLQALVARTAVMSLEGRAVPPREALRASLRSALPVIGMSILVGLGAGLAALALIVPGIIVYCMWAVSVPVLVAEGRGVTDSMGRSRDLTRGSRWRVFAVLAIFFFLSGIVQTALLAVVGIGALADPAAAQSPAMIAVNTASNAALSLLTALATASLYVELRRVKEGATPERLAEIFA